MQTSLKTAPAAQQMAWVRGVAKVFVQPMTDEESHQETCLKTTIISTIQFSFFLSLTWCNGSYLISLLFLNLRWVWVLGF